MDIIKSILHVFKKSDNAFKIMHPETESAQITDWNNGIVNTLASTALGGLVNTLTSDSLLATMIKKVLTATGVKYNIAQNGYLCFGSLFGGLIIQWGITTYNNNPDGQTIIPAISFNSFFTGVVVDRGIKWNTGGTFTGVEYMDGGVIFWPQYTGSPQTVSKNGTNYRWLILCA
ncbi:hypothetical protein [Megasphaera sp. UBA4352]|uniref:hypothetical protein n=1 Tax=Megasphaera sp. UBA4352 TaxID=1946849 RepID=UPI003784DB21